MYYGIDPLYIIMMIPVLLLSLYASFKVKSAYKKFSKIASRSGLTGAEVARRILNNSGIGNVNVVETRGFLSDHYDPIKKIVRLSPGVYNGNSIASIGVAAHETGHAIQHAQFYRPLILRNMIAPTASIGSSLSWIIIMLGAVFQAFGLIQIGIVLFSLVVVFQLITLPVEFNASERAKAILVSHGILQSNEIEGVRSVLSAAAMTYVAAAVSAVVTLLYYLMRFGLLGGRDD